MTSRFDTDTAVEALGDGAFAARIDPDWSVGAGPNGGTIAAIVLRAMSATLGEDARPSRSLTIHYLRAPREGPARVETRIERRGRTVTAISARLSQDGRLAAIALASFSGRREGGIELVDTSMPQVPPADQLAPQPETPAAAPPFARHFEFRGALGAPPFTGASEALTGGWIALREPRPVDTVLVAQLTDAWLPAIYATLEAPARVPTIDLTIHFRAPDLVLEPGTFVLGRWHTSLARDGFLEEDGELWAPDGTLIAQSRQLALAS